MLIDVYFPTIRTNYDQVEKRRQEIVDIDIDYQHAYDSGDFDGRRFIAPFINRQKNFEIDVDVLLTQIIIRIREI
jgi:hypothetical protein